MTACRVGTLTTAEEADPAAWSHVVIACARTMPARVVRAVAVLSNRGATSLADALRAGEVAYIHPVPAGDLQATIGDETPLLWLDAGATLILAFESMQDGREFVTWAKDHAAQELAEATSEEATVH